MLASNLFSDQPLDSSFSGSRLYLARMRRGFTQKQLGDELDVDKVTIHRYEKGERTPDAAQLIRLSSVLDFPQSFFYEEPVGHLDPDGISFRSRRSEVKAATRDKTIGSLFLAAKVLDVFATTRFRLNACDVPSITGIPPELTADRLRAEWQLNQHPIGNVVHLLEAKGARVYFFQENDPAVDAVSKVIDSTPFALLSQRKRGGERMRFDLAHELGHLVMHRGGHDLSLKQMEDEANQFASAFLMPREQFRKECPRMPSFNNLLNMKPRWGTSLQAMVHRCRDLGIYTDSQYKYAFQKIGADGWRLNEPGELACEQSSSWEQILKYLQERNVTIAAFCEKLHIFENELYSLVPLARKYENPARQRLTQHFLDLNELGYTPNEESEMDERAY